MENLKSMELDPYCEKILTLFVFQIPHTKETGFNELFKIANKLFRISKPTLAYHLKHLLKLGIIKKRVDRNSSLNLKPTFYFLNWESVKKDIPSEYIRQVQELNKLSVPELMGLLFKTLYIGDLTMSKLLLESTVLKTSNSKAKVWIARQFFLAHQQFLLNKIREKLPELKKEEISKFLLEFDKEITKILKI